MDVEPSERDEAAPDRTTILRAQLGVAIVLVFAVVSGSAGVHDLTTGAGAVTSYGVITARFNEQYEAIRNRLPPRGTIGFVSGSGDDLAFVLAQYDLAPLILKRWPEESVVVGHFETAEAAAGFLARSGPSDRSPPPDSELHAIVVPR